jgi:acyl phosphate:glycerol-3-phosphate acyltransferase
MVVLTLIWMCTGYLLGSVPFSVLLAHWFVGLDLAKIGDGNPGAANAWKAGGWRIGSSAMVLDYLKGALPVAMAHYAFGIDGWGLAAIAICPVLGHAFPVFRAFRGGKALAVTFGIWTGLTLAGGPLVLGLLFIAGIMVLKDHAWTVVLGMLGLLAYLLLRGADLPVLALWGANMAILIWKHLPVLRSSFIDDAGLR